MPGVSRSAATISAGLLTGLGRVAATRLSFLLSILGLVAAGSYEGVAAAGDIATRVGWTGTAVATAASFVVAYVSVARLLRLVAHHRITGFIPYRLLVACLLAAALGTGILHAT